MAIRPVAGQLLNPVGTEQVDEGLDFPLWTGQFDHHAGATDIHDATAEQIDDGQNLGAFLR